MCRYAFTHCDVCRRRLPSDDKLVHFNKGWDPINKWYSTAGFLCCDECWQKIPEAERTRD